MKKRLVLCMLAVIMLCTSIPFVDTGAAAPQIKNVIYLIPDGGGYAPYDFANMVKTAGGFDDSLYPNKTPTTTEPMTMRDYLAGSLTTASYNQSVTDSAAAGTAMATGYKTNNGYVGVDPSGKPLANLVEAAQSVGKATGLVATYEWMHATPAAFSAHAMDRNDYENLYQQIENQGLDVVLGTGYDAVSGYATIQNALDRGYSVISDREQLKSVAPGDRLWGNMAKSMPYDINLSSSQATIAEMTKAAITALSGDEDGFFLMVEGSKVDSGGHANDAVITTSEYLAFDAAFKVAVDFAKGRTDTVVICAPDHDTGGMNPAADMWAEIAQVQKGTNPSTMSWTTTGHTARNGGVWMYAPEGVPVVPGLNSVLGDTAETRTDYIIDNTALAPYVASLFGVDMENLTRTLFTDVSDIGVYVGGKFIFNNGTKYVYANQSVYYKDGQEISMDGQVAVYVNKRFYVPAKMVEAADWTTAKVFDGFAGTGTKADPYIMANAYDFAEFTENVLAGNTYSGKYFKQTANLNLANNPFYNGMGKAASFYGVYDGNGYCVNVSIETSRDNCIFPYVFGTVMNLGTTGTINSTGDYSGGIARSLRSGAKIINCYSTMAVNGTNAAGLVWSNYGEMVNCYFGGTVSGGGLRPIANNNGGTYSSCYYVTDCGSGQTKTGIVAVDKAVATSTLAATLNDGLQAAEEAAGENLSHIFYWEHKGQSLPSHIYEPVTDSAFKKISLSLGQDITLRYFVEDRGYTNPQLRFTINNYTDTVKGEKYGELLVFVFKGVAPQWVGDTVTAELVVDGTAMETKDYSALTYLTKLKETTAATLGYSEEKYKTMITLVEDLLVYAGAAQTYTDHNTQNLVSAGITGTTFVSITETDFAIKDGSYITFKGATVNFNSVNRLKFRFVATDLTGLSFKLAIAGGEEGEVVYTANGDGSYTIVTDAIYAIKFDDVYTLTAYKNGVEDAKLSYSIKTYVASMQDKDSKMAALAKATYNYGLAAKAFKNAM